jgi:hypothetical protein
LAFLSALLFAVVAAVSPPKFTVTPQFSPEPATVTFLLTNIPERARTACFVLDGSHFYGGCKDVDGRKSYRVEYRGVLGGHYQALVTVDDQQLPLQEVVITKQGPE